MAHHGASSGLGYALAKYVLEQGDRVAMGARTVRGTGSFWAATRCDALA